MFIFSYSLYIIEQFTSRYEIVQHLVVGITYRVDRNYLYYCAIGAEFNEVLDVDFIILFIYT